MSNEKEGLLPPPMRRFRKKPIVITAEQFFVDAPLPRGVEVYPCQVDVHCKCEIPHVHTAHEDQVVYVVHGDWIVPEKAAGRFYPIKPDVFAATYDEVIDG